MTKKVQTMIQRLKRVVEHKLYFLVGLLCLFLVKPALTENFEIEASGFLEWNQEIKSYIASGDAIAVQGKRIIKADEIIAFYESEESRDITRIEATGSVDFRDSSSFGYSDKLIYEMSTRTVTLTGSKNFFKSEMFTAKSSNQILFDEMKGILLLQEEAHVLISEGRKMEAQRLEIKLADGGDVKTINAKGDVKLTEEAGRIAYSNAAFYTAETGEMTLLESVKILDGSNQLLGDKAIINMNSGYSKILADGENKRVTGKLVLGTSN